MDGSPPQNSHREHAPDRRAFLLSSGIAAAAMLTRPDIAVASTETIADFLFVQTAESIGYDPATKRLTLDNVSPVTLFFADRPERLAGNMSTAAFVPFWSKGKDSFLSDAPNADLSILEGDTLRQTVVVLHDPVLEGRTLAYTVDVIDGEMPAKGASASLFIDIIGMPLTPLSYAGARRRFYRRAVLY